MARSRRKSHHSDGITDQKSLQRTSATKSAISGHQPIHSTTRSARFVLKEFRPTKRVGMTNSAITNTANEDTTVRKIADEAFAAFNSGHHVLPFSTRYPAFSLNDAYRAAALAHNMRIAKGYTPRGPKNWIYQPPDVGQYGVHAPIWGYVYDRTMHDLAASLSLAAYTEAKIEPEIIFGFAAAPSPSMDDAALLSCIAWLAHGFEVAQSIFPDWKFAVADTVVADGMHGALLIGPCHDVSSRAGEWLDTLANFHVELYCDGQLMDRGHASNVLGGPLSAVRLWLSCYRRTRNTRRLQLVKSWRAEL